MNKKIGWLLLLFYQVCHAEPAIEVTTKYYEVVGSTAATIRANMNKNRSDDYDAYTHWHVNWSFDTEQVDDFCEINQVEVTLKIKFTLPHWEADWDTSDEVEELWDDYYTALIAHENQHKAIAIEAAEEIENALNDLDEERHCKRLKKIANATANEIINDYKEQQVQFDEDTDHGIDDGAVFP